jgi:Tfp pilus assembly protein PilW
MSIDRHRMTGPRSASSPRGIRGSAAWARSQRAFTLVELMIAASISVFILGTVMVSFVVMGRCFNAVGNYADLDRQSRNALDVMARDIRQTGALTNWSTTNLSFTNMDGHLLSYTYQTNIGVLSYTNASTGQSNVLLTNCTALTFSIFQRTPTNGCMTFYAASNAQSAKGVLMSFTCVRTNYATLTDSEAVETASIIMRNQ